MPHVPSRTMQLSSGTRYPAPPIPLDPIFKVCLKSQVHSDGSATYLVCHTLTLPLLNSRGVPSCRSLSLFGWASWLSNQSLSRGLAVSYFSSVAHSSRSWWKHNCTPTFHPVPYNLFFRSLPLHLTLPFFLYPRTQEPA